MCVCYWKFMEENNCYVSLNTHKSLQNLLSLSGNDVHYYNRIIRLFSPEENNRIVGSLWLWNELKESERI